MRAVRDEGGSWVVFRRREVRLPESVRAGRDMILLSPGGSFLLETEGAPGEVGSFPR